MSLIVLVNFYTCKVAMSLLLTVLRSCRAFGRSPTGQKAANSDQLSPEDELLLLLLLLLLLVVTGALLNKGELVNIRIGLPLQSFRHNLK